MLQKRLSLVYSLGFRVGVIIILTEIIMLTIIGVIYFNNFNAEVENRLEQNALLPLQLLNSGLLSIDSVTNGEQMRNIAGEDVLNALIVGINDNIFFSLEPDLLGRRFSTLSEYTIDLGAMTSPTLSVNSRGNIVSAAPLIGEDGRSVRFYGVLEISTARATAQRAALIQLFVFGGVITVIATSVAILLIFNFTIYGRIRTTITALNAVQQGNLQTRIDRPGRDEIGTLQARLNSMIERLEESFSTLEARVLLRTYDLTVSAEVSQRIATILNTQSLLTQVAELTLTSFKLYQVNVYLFNAETKTLRLAYGTGEAGAAMVAAHKAYHIDDKPGLVPLAARTQKPAVINDVVQSSDHNRNDLLPNTRSEAAFPILYGGQIIGVIDFQSDTVDRFRENDEQLFTAFANQIAVAIRNASLFEEAIIARAQAERSDTVKSAFLASMSHELRTPLNAIINFAKFLRRGIPGAINERQEQYITSIAESGQHLLSLINDVLDMSKIEAGALKLFVEPDIDMRALVQSAVDYFRPLIGEKPVVFDVTLPEAVPLISGDRKRLFQVALNILSNAVKFTDEGSITVTMGYSDGAIRISIADTGIGIDAADRDGVFTPFQQTESGLRQGSGTGLGMPISKKLVEAHGGKLWFDSELGRGTTFFIEIPAEILDT